MLRLFLRLNIALRLPIELVLALRSVENHMLALIVGTEDQSASLTADRADVVDGGGVVGVADAAAERKG